LIKCVHEWSVVRVGMGDMCKVGNSGRGEKIQTHTQREKMEEKRKVWVFTQRKKRGKEGCGGGTLVNRELKKSP